MASSLSKKIEILESKDEQFRLNEEILRIENTAQINYLDATTLIFINEQKSLNLFAW